jgi:hypothetical protein
MTQIKQKLTKIHACALAVCCVAALALAAPAFAQYGSVVVVRGGGYPGYYGYRGWYGGYYPWGWGGPGAGPYFATLPYYYAPYWYGGVPYYSGYSYPAWGPAASQYRKVAQPAVASNQSVGQAPSELMVYPKSGQSEYQQATDRYECYRWAISQLGYDPTTAGSETAPRDLTDYNRAQTACLTARGYSVK